MTYTPGPNDVSYGATPPPTGEIEVPQSPSGVISQDTGESKSATQSYLQDVLQVQGPQQGTPILATAPQMAGTGPQTFYSGTTSGVTE